MVEVIFNFGLEEFVWRWSIERRDTDNVSSGTGVEAVVRRMNRDMR